MSHPLDVCDIRIQRAGDHIASLVQVFKDLNDQRIEDVQLIGPDANGNARITFNGNEPIPPIVSLLIGETAYNLKAALDYLVYTLACFANGNRHVSGTQFPIVDARTDFDRLAPIYLRRIPDPYVRAIERFQPYHDGSEWTRILRDLHNPDKHRELTTILLRGTATVKASDPAGIPPWSDKGNLSIPFEGTMNLQVLFAEHDLPVSPTLQMLQGNVSLLVDSFKPAFEV